MDSIKSNIFEKIGISQDALVPANNLRSSNLQRRQLKKVVTDIVRRINQELISAHKEGKHFIITNIPITYSIANMANKDSQRFVWSNVIRELKSKQYRVDINPTKDVCRLKITWMRDTDSTEMTQQMELIIKHTKVF